MTTWWQDLRYAARVLLKKPAFTIISIASLALGIGANTAIFTVINAVFLHPLAIEDPSRVVEAFTKDNKTVSTTNFVLTGTSIQNFEDYRTETRAFTGLAAFFPFGLQWKHDEKQEVLPGTLASGNYFDVLGIKAFRGRLFTAEDDAKLGSGTVAVLSHSLWTRQFGADPSVIGRQLTLNNIPFTVIGVTPPNFKGTFSLAGPDVIWVPMSMREQLANGQLRQLMNSRRFRWVSIVGRLAPGVGIRQAEAALKTIAAALERQYPVDNQGRTVELAYESDAALGINQRGQLVLAGSVMMGVVGLVLLIACVNLANLLLAQAAQREREITIRSAMGASRTRIMRQLLTESVLLAAAGGGAGLLVAYWGRNALWSFRPPFLGNASIDLSFDPRVLSFTAGMSLFTGLLFGLAPALRVSRVDLNEVLKSGGRSGSMARNRMRSGLVIAEIALATVALIGAGLFIRSMQAAQEIDPGFDARHIGIVNLNPGGQRYDRPRGEQYYRDAVERARAVPGVEGAAAASIAPLGGGIAKTVFPEGEQHNPNYRGALVPFNSVTPGYFAAIRLPLRAGRGFEEFDRAESKAVVIVNETLARQLWPGQDAVGKRLFVVQEPAPLEVVGIAADSVINQIGESPQPALYLPIAQEYVPAAVLLVRAKGNPEPLLGGVVTSVKQLDRNMPLAGTRTVQQAIDAGLWAPRMGAALLGIFGGLALVLAMIGVYGVMSYSVSQRTQEIGIRMALGAESADVLGLVLRQGMLLSLGGTAAGVAAALVAGRVVSGLLFGISARDPLTLASVAGILAAVGLVACWIPARRATRVDPLVSLRYE